MGSPRQPSALHLIVGLGDRLAYQVRVHEALVLLLGSALQQQGVGQDPDEGGPPTSAPALRLTPTRICANHTPRDTSHICAGTRSGPQDWGSPLPNLRRDRTGPQVTSMKRRRTAKMFPNAIQISTPDGSQSAAATRTRSKSKSAEICRCWDCPSPERDAPLRSALRGAASARLLLGAFVCLFACVQPRVDVVHVPRRSLSPDRNVRRDGRHATCNAACNTQQRGVPRSTAHRTPAAHDSVPDDEGHTCMLCRRGPAGGRGRPPGFSRQVRGQLHVPRSVGRPKTNSGSGVARPPS